MKYNHKKYAVTDDMISACRAYLLARVYAEAKKEQVDEVYSELLIEMPFYETRVFGKRHTPTGAQILDHDKLYLTDDEDGLELLYKVASDELRKRGIKPDDMADEFCPALVADSIRRDAERLLMIGKSLLIYP